VKIGEKIQILVKDKGEGLQDSETDYTVKKEIGKKGSGAKLYTSSHLTKHSSH
jgi:hypothetical protein